MGSRIESDLNIDPVTTEGESPRVRINSEPIRRFSNEFKDVQFCAYLSGYVDGEGCFSVSLSPRSKMRSGWEVRPSFSVSQNADRADFLYEIQKYFNCGTIRPDRSDKTLKYEIRSITVIVNRIIPHFQRFPLRSQKQNSFLLFAKLCYLITEGKHLKPEGLKLVFKLASKINGGKRKYVFDENT